MMKLAITCIAAFLLANTFVCYSQVGYVIPGQPSIDCTKVHNTVAVILCKVPEAAQADWNLNSAWWALYFTVNDTQRRMLDTDQQAWRQSLDRICVMPRFPKPEDQAGQAMAEAFGRMLLGPGLRIPGPQPITQANVNCVLNAYHARAAMLRSKLTGDALAESQLSPKQHAELQAALTEKGFLRSDQIGPGTHDGEFGPITRNAIKEFQQSLGASTSGFLSNDQTLALLENPQEREAAKQITHPAPNEGKTTTKEPPSGREAADAEDADPKPTQITSLSDYAKHIKHRWVKYDENGNQTSYIDLASIIRTDDTLTVLDLQDFNPPIEVVTGEPLGSILNLMRYDCGSRPRSMIMASAEFHGNMGSGTQQEGASDVPTEPSRGWYVMPARDWDGKENTTLKARDMACNASSDASPASNSEQARASINCERNGFVVHVYEKAVRVYPSSGINWRGEIPEKAIDELKDGDEFCSNYELEQHVLNGYWRQAVYSKDHAQTWVHGWVYFEKVRPRGRAEDQD